MKVVLRAVPVALLLVGASVRAQPTGPVGAGGAGGDIRVADAYVGDDGATSSRPVYLTLTDDGAAPDLLEAAVAPAAVSTTWEMRRPVHTAAEVAAFTEPCGADPRLLAQSTAALLAGGDVLVPAHGSLRLVAGVGELRLDGIGPLARGATVGLTLYFASGAVVALRVPVRGG